MPKTEKQVIGAWGEEQAALFLLQEGYEVFERNYRVRQGEIDIIAWHEKRHFGRTLCFIEVKTRAANDGSAERATGREKLGNILKTARMYCVEKGIPDTIPIQFEQVSVYQQKDGGAFIQTFVIPVE